MKKPRRYGKVANVIDRTFHRLLTLKVFDAVGLFHHYDENTMFKGENDGSERFTNSLRR